MATPIYENGIKVSDKDTYKQITGIKNGYVTFLIEEDPMLTAVGMDKYRPFVKGIAFDFYFKNGEKYIPFDNRTITWPDFTHFDHRMTAPDWSQAIMMRRLPDGDNIYVKCTLMLNDEYWKNHDMWPFQAEAGGGEIIVPVKISYVVEA